MRPISFINGAPKASSTYDHREEIRVFHAFGPQIPENIWVSKAEDTSPKLWYEFDEDVIPAKVGFATRDGRDSLEQTPRKFHIIGKRGGERGGGGGRGIAYL